MEILVVVMALWPRGPAQHGCRSPIPGEGWRRNAGPCGTWQASGCRPDGGDAMEGDIEAGSVSRDLGESPRDPEETRGSLVERGRSHTRAGRGRRAGPLA